VASNCIRTLLLQTPKSLADQSIARYLLPHLIAFVSNTETEDPEKARSLIAHALTGYVATLPNDKKGIAMALVIPTLLTRANSEGEGDELYQETSARLLGLASVDPTGFKVVVAGLNEGQRGFMEEVLRTGQKTGRKVERDTGKEEPSIALRMNFGGV
jgi:HEAT repeat-containing protein 5